MDKQKEEAERIPKEQAEQNPINPLQHIEYGVYSDLMNIYPKPYTIYFRSAINLKPEDRESYWNGDVGPLSGDGDAGGVIPAFMLLAWSSMVVDGKRVILLALIK